jgi:hypothetical protein
MQQIFSIDGIDIHQDNKIEQKARKEQICKFALTILAQGIGTPEECDTLK